MFRHTREMNQIIFCYVVNRAPGAVASVLSPIFADPNVPVAVVHIQ